MIKVIIGKTLWWNLPMALLRTYLSFFLNTTRAVTITANTAIKGRNTTHQMSSFFLALSDPGLWVEISGSCDTLQGLFADKIRTVSIKVDLLVLGRLPRFPVWLPRSTGAPVWCVMKVSNEGISLTLWRFHSGEMWCGNELVGEMILSSVKVLDVFPEALVTTSVLWSHSFPYQPAGHIFFGVLFSQE